MSRAERIARRNKEKDFFKVMERNAERLNDTAFAEQLKELGLPCCPRCNTPIMAGFGDDTGNYDLCLKCGAEIPEQEKDNNLSA